MRVPAGIGQQVRLCALLGVSGWRQAKHWQKMLKKAFQKASRVRHHHGLFEKIIRHDLALADHLMKTLTQMRATLEAASAGVLVDKSQEYLGYAHLLRDQVERRVLKGETIPHDEKIFSVFEPHTRWISKGKAGTPVEP